MDGKRQLTVSAVQITAVDGEKAATVDKMAGWLDVAGGRGSDLVVLPELWTGLEAVLAASLLAIPAAMSGMLGFLIERWLFFAEAQHVVTLCYGADSA